MTTSRRLQVGLGLLWLLDAALQCQPFMFTGGFADEVLRASGDGQPAVVAAPAHAVAALVAHAPALFNSGFAAVQLMLGVALLIPRTVRVGLAGSVVWGVSIWLFGEGLGGLTSGHLSLLTGAPGAAALYAVIAVAAWPRRDAPAGMRRLAVRSWVTLWVLGAVAQLLPGQNSGAAIASAIVDAAADAPGWLHAPLSTFAAGIPSGVAVAVALALVQLLVGVVAVVPGPARRIAVSVGLLLTVMFFVAGQSLGEITTGRATDPNTAPLVALLALATAGVTRVTVRPRAHPHPSAAAFRTVVEPIP